MKRVGFVIGAVLLVAGAFWTGRESSHGWGAFTEHWWCVLPLVIIVLGAASVVVTWRFFARLA